MNVKELLEALIRQENELYNLHKLGETFATFEKIEFADTFRLMAEEELRHRKTLESMLSEGSLEESEMIDYLDALSLEPVLKDERAEPKSLEELVVEALIREQHAYEMYSKLSKILGGSLGHIFRMMAGEELKHVYRLKIMYEAL
ncbi:ferritin family protein [Thermococcus gammatolerans]|uniref:Rubrerythrin diiron-binding domain-containing protein n=1 Tax=Thermococcus gammatolerans (strain DSM 15229 / JCM 11827 / EJ3) TaxID=593117 RepID=C5A3W3_THEGJ|nr:ferritin family protein [Thermococcus gammatolerans]ACS32925.1 Conserved hypothetical protein [Thermococcus gammatolerans EJ3]